MPRERKLRLGYRGACTKHRSSSLRWYTIAIPSVSNARELTKQPAHKHHAQHGKQPQCSLDDDVRGNTIGYEAVLFDE